jgi:hypothetical protein
VALAEGHVEEAAANFRESLDIRRTERLAELSVWVVEGLPTVALEHAAPVEAIRLLAATTRPRAELGFGADHYPSETKCARERWTRLARSSASPPSAAGRKAKPSPWRPRRRMPRSWADLVCH